MTAVTIREQPLGRFLPIVGHEAMDAATSLAGVVRVLLAGRTLWNVNSTPIGGGVAEMLRSLLPYVRGAGTDVRWAVLEAEPEFFRLTKRLHHTLHGSPGDGSVLESEERRIYEATARENARRLCGAIRPRDVVVLHDPQTAGLAPYMIDAGAMVIWRCHIGHDQVNAEVEHGWAFLAPYLSEVPAFVFSRRTYVPECCDHGKTSIITPSIDAFSAKNQDLDDPTVRAILARVGLLDGAPSARATFTREDGSVGCVERPVEIIRSQRAPAPGTPLVVQVSRWDPLKDPLGVLLGFANLVRNGDDGRAELVLAGPNVSAVADDPEGATVFAEVLAAWQQLPDTIRGRIHLASLPTEDVDENAAIVNALQRHAAVVVQKSLHEGFGLTVTEAMWKARPVLAGSVGGICDQIVDGVHGVLLDDPTALDDFAKGLHRLLSDADYARRLGCNARDRVREHFLGPNHLMKYARLISRLECAYQAAGCPRRLTASALRVFAELNSED
jgi:trehalose synthase